MALAGSSDLGLRFSHSSPLILINYKFRFAFICQKVVLHGLNIPAETLVRNTQALSHAFNANPYAVPRHLVHQLGHAQSGWVGGLPIGLFSFLPHLRLPLK